MLISNNKKAITLQALETNNLFVTLLLRLCDPCTTLGRIPLFDTDNVGRLPPQVLASINANQLPGDGFRPQ